MRIACFRDIIFRFSCVLPLNTKRHSLVGILGFPSIMLMLFLRLLLPYRVGSLIGDLEGPFKNACLLLGYFI